MTSLRHSKLRHGPQGLTMAAISAAVVVAVGSAAWACVPSNPDRQTKFARCSPPTGSSMPCKVPLGHPDFPDAVFVKGPSGSSFDAYVAGPGMAIASYDLVYASKAQLEAGQPCGSSASIKLAGPIAGNNSISTTTAVMPTGSPLGLGQVCFTDVLRRQTLNTQSTPAQFKVTL